MAEQRVIGIEVSLIEELIRAAVRDEVGQFKEEIKTILAPKTESLLHEERLNKNDVATIFNKSRHTIDNWIKSGLLPQPGYDLSNRPYWTPDQLEQALKLTGIKTKFPT